MENWRTQSAAEQGRAIARGELDPVALTQDYLEAAAGADSVYARLSADRAMAEAEAAAARAKSGLLRGPLDGVPISWKDLFDTAGVATEAGTQLMAGRIPERDAACLEISTDNGLIFLGKTHLSEIAFSGLGVNPMTATAPNHAFPGAAPGGSSSGSAASVALGLAAASVGTDTGGSVRIPSAWNNLVGLKTAHGNAYSEAPTGAISKAGVVPLADAFDSVGPICRTVEDAALMYAALGGCATDLGGASLRGTRIGVLTTVAQDALDSEVAQGFAHACDILRAAGATLVEFEAPEVDAAFGISGPLYTADAWSYWGPMIEAAPDKMWYHIRNRVSVGGDVLAADYLRNWAQLRALRAEFHARTAGFDAWICPTVAILPPLVERLLADDDYYVEANLMALRNTRIGNLMGLCGLSVPSGMSGVGVLINGAAGREGQVLRLGRAFEMARG